MVKGNEEWIDGWTDGLWPLNKEMVTSPQYFLSTELNTLINLALSKLTANF